MFEHLWQFNFHKSPFLDPKEACVEGEGTWFSFLWCIQREKKINNKEILITIKRKREKGEKEKNKKKREKKMFPKIQMWIKQCEQSESTKCFNLKEDPIRNYKKNKSHSF